MESLNVPQHFAIIMDGNGRWAKNKNLSVKFGHKAGADALEKILRTAHNFGVKYLSVYAFSTENWKRSDSEVKDLMQLFSNYFDALTKNCGKNDVKVKCIGNIFGLSEDLQKKISKIEEMTKDKDGMTFIIAINYGAHDEILRAVKNICNQVLTSKLLPSQLTEDFFASFLDTKNIPDPDLLIRTAGEMRLSNFLLWQLAYSEFYFSDKFWPDFSEQDFLDAIKNFSARKRRFGTR